MSPQTLFALVFPLAVPFWLLIIVLPGWAMTHRIVSSPLIAVPPLLIYLAVLIASGGPFVAAVTAASFPDLVTVLGTQTGVLLIWAHLIAFDLLIGRWMYLDYRQHAISPLLMAPIFILTILLSPLGLLSYLLVRGLALSRAGLRARAEAGPVTAGPAPADPPPSEHSPAPRR